MATYDWGYGAGDGEEYYSIPGYEGPNGYFDLRDDLNLPRWADLPTEFVNPKNGRRYPEEQLAFFKQARKNYRDWMQEEAKR